MVNQYKGFGCHHCFCALCKFFLLCFFFRYPVKKSSLSCVCICQQFYLKALLIACSTFSVELLNAVGSLVGIFIGAFMGMSTESGMLRGAGVGAVSGAVFSIEAVESCIEIWRSSESGKYSIIFVLDIISSLFSGRIVWEKVSPALQRAVQSQMSLLSTPFIDNNDLFETGSTGGMSRDLINKIPRTTFSAATNSDQETDNCCAVCLQDFGASQFVRVLPHCQHTFHERCIDNWLFRHASCPLCRAGVHIDHIHM
uniref:RING-type domain-containing protein n=1 Tax=Oryza brachyantha TaxID=4533 RepID=J3MKU1_ORYBR